MTNFHIYPTPFTNESRILKETNSLLKLKLVSDIVIISTWKAPLPKTEEIDKYRKIIRVKGISNYLPDHKIFKLIKYIEFSLSVIFKLLFKKVDIVNCHSLMVLPIGVLIKFFKGSKLIYDAHELETERIGLHGLAQKVSKFFERKLIKFIDRIIVVSPSIAEWYKQAYNLDTIYTIKNVPNKREEITSDILRKKFNLVEEDVLFIYQGLFGTGRGIDIYLNVFAKSSPNHHIVLMGYGDLEDKIKSLALKHKNIHFHPAVKPSEIIDYTCSADIGLCLFENHCLSHYYALPNKLFEYIMAGVPPIISDFPDMNDIISRHDCGWSVNVSQESLFETVNSITKEVIKHKKSELSNCRLEYNWENEEKHLIEVYQHITN